MERYEGRIPAYEGFSSASEEGKSASLEEAISNAAENAYIENDDGEWFEVARIQAQLLPHNQWVKAYRVTITPTG